MVSVPKLLRNDHDFISIQLIGYHAGAVWDMDPDFESKYVLTACADANARMFEVTTGKYMARMPHKG